MTLPRASNRSTVTPAKVRGRPSSTQDAHHSTAARLPDTIGSPNRHSTSSSAAKVSVRSRRTPSWPRSGSRNARARYDADSEYSAAIGSGSRAGHARVQASTHRRAGVSASGIGTLDVDHRNAASHPEHHGDALLVRRVRLAMDDLPRDAAEVAGACLDRLPAAGPVLHPHAPGDAVEEGVEFPMVVPTGDPARLGTGHADPRSLVRERLLPPHPWGRRRLSAPLVPADHLHRRLHRSLPPHRAFGAPATIGESARQPWPSR